MSKTAREMFEELGYKNDDSNESIIVYKFGWKTISFFKTTQTIRIDLDFVDDVESVKYINCNDEELKTINKQVEELGWLK